jgi:uncharacterized protein YkwD
MLKEFFIPTSANNYTPILLKRGLISLYTLVLLAFNIGTANIASLKAYAQVDSQSLLDLHNEARQQQGLGDLTLNSKLVFSAQNKAEAMLGTNCWDHYCPDGKSPWEFFDAAGYDYVYAGENLAEGFSDNNKVFNAWMNSKTHKDNILRSDFQEIGIAIVYGDYQDIENNAIIVVHFGSREISPNSASVESSTNENYADTFAIRNPKQDEVVNSNTPEISGVSPDGSVEISEGTNGLGESIAKEGLFTYRIPDDKALVDGVHTLAAAHTTQNYEDDVTFSVDTIPPVLSDLSFDSIVGSGDDKQVILTITTSPDTMSLETAAKDITFTKMDATSWQVILTPEQIENSDLGKLQLTAYDIASNKSSTEFDLSEIKNQYSKAKIELENDPEINLSILKEIGVRRLLNVVFIIFFIILLVVDYYVLSTSQLPVNFIKTKLNYHASVFVILLLVSLAGGTSGELLDGKSL